MIFDQSWIKKHKVIIYIINNFLIFWFSDYTYINVDFFLSLLSLSITTTAITTEKNITLKKIIKRQLKKDIINLMQRPNKLFNKKRDK